MTNTPNQRPQNIQSTDSLLTRFVGGAASIGIGNLSTMFFGILGVMVVVRVLPAAVFGSYVLLQVVASFLTRFSSFGLDLAIQRFLPAAEDEAERRRLINTSLFFRLLTILCVSGMAFLAKPLLVMLFDAEMIDMFFGAVLLLYALESLGQLLQATLQGVFSFQVVARCHLISSLMGFVLLLVFVLYLDMGLLGLVYAKAFAMAASSLFALTSMSNLLRTEFGLEQISQLLAFGLPLQISDILTFIFLRIDTLMIGALLGPAEIAFYEIARKIPESITRIYEAFRSVYLPFMSRLYAQAKLEKAANMLNHSTRLISLAAAFSSLIALLFGKEIITFLFSDIYLPSVPIFVVLMVGFNISLIDYTLGYSLVAVGEAKKTALVNVVHASVSLIGSFLLIPRFKLFGAAIARLMGFALVNPLNVYFLRRRLRVEVWPYVKPVLIFGLCWLATLLWTPTLLQKLFIIAGFGAACWFFDVITRADMTAIQSEAKIAQSKALHFARERGVRSV